MAEIEQVPLQMGGFKVNAYIIHGEESDVIVDAGTEPEKILAAVRRPVEAVLLTHGHADHVAVLDDILRATNAPVYVHPDDASDIGIDVYEPLDEGQVLRLAGEDIRVLHTPGHCPGSVTFVIGDDQIVGDLVMPGSVGRTDISGASWEDLEVSVRKVMEFWNENTRLYAGHGEVMNAAEEVRTNPYLPPVSVGT